MVLVVFVHLLLLPLQQPQSTSWLFCRFWKGGWHCWRKIKTKNLCSRFGGPWHKSVDGCGLHRHKSVDRWLWLSYVAKNLMRDLTCKYFSKILLYLPCLLALLSSFIICVVGGHKVSRKQNLLASFSKTSVPFRNKSDLLLTRLNCTIQE